MFGEYADPSASATTGMEEIDFTMTNYDGSATTGMAEALQARPGEVFGRHVAWNFFGRVWFADGLFHEEVKRYGAVVDDMSAPTLEELMMIVNNRSGWD